MSDPTEGGKYRFDRHGRRSLVVNPQQAGSLAAVNARIVAREKAALKAQQDAGVLNASERLLVAIFGEIE